MATNLSMEYWLNNPDVTFQKVTENTRLTESEKYVIIKKRFPLELMRWLTNPRMDEDSNYLGGGLEWFQNQPINDDGYITLPDGSLFDPNAMRFVTTTPAGGGALPTGAFEPIPGSGVYWDKKGGTYWYLNPSTKQYEQIDGTQANDIMSTYIDKGGGGTGTKYKTNPDGSPQTITINGHVYPLNEDGTPDYSNDLGPAPKTTVTPKPYPTTPPPNGYHYELDPNTGEWNPAYGSSEDDDALAREQFEWQKQEAERQRQQTEQQRLAQLAANPLNWMEYSAAANKPPVWQEWQGELKPLDDPNLRTPGQFIPGLYGPQGLPDTPRPQGSPPLGNPPAVPPPQNGYTEQPWQPGLGGTRGTAEPIVTNGQVNNWNTPPIGSTVGATTTSGTTGGLPSWLANHPAANTGAAGGGATTAGGSASNNPNPYRWENFYVAYPQFKGQVGDTALRVALWDTGWFKLDMDWQLANGLIDQTKYDMEIKTMEDYAAKARSKPAIHLWTGPTASTYTPPARTGYGGVTPQSPISTQSGQVSTQNGGGSAYPTTTQTTSGGPAAPSFVSSANGGGSQPSSSPGIPDYSKLPYQLNPSMQYYARLGPDHQGQYQSYQRAKTGQTPEQIQWNLWNMAPPGGSRFNLGYRR